MAISRSRRYMQHDTKKARHGYSSSMRIAAVGRNRSDPSLKRSLSDEKRS